jgi:hypothetical protein
VAIHGQRNGLLRYVSLRDIADAFSAAIDLPVSIEIVPCGTWEAKFRAQARAILSPRMRMLDGCNEG